MKIAIVGTGYVGLVTGTCLAEIDAGNIICVDIDDIKTQNDTVIVMAHAHHYFECSHRNIHI